MLKELHVRNIALIDDVSLSFDGGLNILTGETGAGKSILIDALGLALGDRAAGIDLIKNGADRAAVDAIFDISLAPTSLLGYLEEIGISDLDESILISTRELALSNGKSVCRLNGRTVPLSVLRTVGDFMVDIHGQHEHQSLLQPTRHMSLLDGWSGSESVTLSSRLKADWKELKRLLAEQLDLNRGVRDRQRSLDLYRFQVTEIDDAKLDTDLHHDLVEERDRLANAEKISASLSAAVTLVSGDGAMGSLNDAAASTERAMRYDGSLASILDSLRAAISHSEDAAQLLSRYLDKLDSAPDRLDEIENRIQAIKSLQKKYGDTIGQILEFRDAAAAKLSLIENCDERASELEKQIDEIKRNASITASRLSGIRQTKALEFAGRIERELHDIGMTATRFEVSVSRNEISESGIDAVEFLISPNPGEPLRPLAKIASGGEISRVMLAIKSVLAATSAVPTMIFDEIDVGIGGRTAHVVGEKLALLGKTAQLLCITHLAQVACVPSRHFVIVKTLGQNDTTVTVHELSKRERIEEISRMLGGSAASEAASTHASEMLESAALRLHAV